MLSPGDMVLLDGDTNIGQKHVVRAVERREDGMYYEYEDAPGERVVSTRITKHVIYT